MRLEAGHWEKASRKIVYPAQSKEWLACTNNWGFLTVSMTSTHPVEETSHKNATCREYICVCVCVHACVCWVTLVVSDSLRPYGLLPARLLSPWDSPGKSIEMGSHFLLWLMSYVFLIAHSVSRILLAAGENAHRTHFLPSLRLGPCREDRKNRICEDCYERGSPCADLNSCPFLGASLHQGRLVICLSVIIGAFVCLECWI